MDRQIGPNLKKGCRDPWIAKWVRILIFERRDPWTAKSVCIFKFRNRDQRTVRIFNRDARIHGLPNWFVFFNWDARTHEPLNNGIKEPWFWTFFGFRKIQKTELKNSKLVEPKIQKHKNANTFFVCRTQTQVQKNLVFNSRLMIFVTKKSWNDRFENWLSEYGQISEWKFQMDIFLHLLVEYWQTTILYRYHIWHQYWRYVFRLNRTSTF